MVWTRLPIEQSAQELLDEAVAYLIDRSGGQWVPDKGAVESWLLEVWTRQVARLFRLAATVPDAAVARIGTDTVQVARHAGAPAETASTWTMRSDAGHTIAAGTLVTVGVDQTLFAVLEDVTVPQGNTTTDPGEVQLQALTVGAAANGIPAGTARLVETDPTVLSIVTTATTSGGVDEETDTEYLDRLADELRLFSLVARLVEEFAIVARRVPGVARARAFKGVDLDTGDTDVPGHVTVALVDADGDAVDAEVEDAAETELTSDDRRALNVVVHITGPTPVEFTVAWAGTARDGYDPADVAAAGTAALEAALDPATWGTTEDDRAAWEDRDTVHINDLIGILYEVDGLRTVTSLTINGGTSDLDLTEGGTNLAPLPDATVTGTVT